MTLLKHKNGHINDAYQRSDIQGMEHIDLVWGSPLLGVMHVINERCKKNGGAKSAMRVLEHLSETIRNGKPNQIKGGRVRINYGKFSAVFANQLNQDKTKRNVLTAFEER